jgi:hypothetical protein
MINNMKNGGKAKSIHGSGGSRKFDTRGYEEIMKDAGAKTATDIAAIKKMLKKYSENVNEDGSRPITTRNIIDATKRHLKKRNPHFEEHGGLLNKKGMGNPYNKGGSVKAYSKGGGVRTANNNE